MGPQVSGLERSRKVSKKQDGRESYHFRLKHLVLLNPSCTVRVHANDSPLQYLGQLTVWAGELFVRDDPFILIEGQLFS